MVSVIIPTCNRPESLRRALRSLRAQQDAIWEAIVVDDGDSEGLSAARAFGDQRIRAYRNPGSGQTRARNAALEVVRGSVIAFLNDTDWWEDPLYLHRVCQALHQGEALVCNAGWIVTELGRAEIERQPFPLHLTPASLRLENPVQVSGVAYPTVMHDWLGGFDETLEPGWDWDWYLRVTDLGVPLRRIDEPSVCVGVQLRYDHQPHQTDPRAHDLERVRHKHGLSHTRSETRDALAIAAD